MISEIFSTRLRETRKVNNLTLQELGENVEMKKSTLSEIENCKEHISFDAAIRIAEYFYISIDYLVGRNDDPQHEYYFQKAENALLLDMPEGFITIFKYAKNKGLKQEPISLQEHFQLIKWFEEWKQEIIIQREYRDAKESYDKKEENYSDKKTAGEWRHDKALTDNLGRLGSISLKLPSIPMPSQLSEYLLPIVEADIRQDNEDYIKK